MSGIGSVTPVNVDASSSQPTDDQAVQDGIMTFAISLASSIREDSEKTEQTVEQHHQELVQQG
jgi:hypothetical protein